MYETKPVDLKYCKSIKKRVNCVNKVAFELFIEVIFIPRYTKQHCRELWWNADELHSSTLSAHKEFVTLVKKYPLLTLDQAKHVLY